MADALHRQMHWNIQVSCEGGVLPYPAFYTAPLSHIPVVNGAGEWWNATVERRSLSLVPSQAHTGRSKMQPTFVLMSDVSPSLSFRGHKGTIRSLVSHADRLYSTGGDGTIKVWDIADFRRGCLKTVHAHKDCVRDALPMLQPIACQTSAFSALTGYVLGGG